MKRIEGEDKEIGVFLPNKEVGWVVSLLLFLCFFMFTTGYFFGQRRAISCFLNKVEEESFADKITYSLCVLNGKDVEGEESVEPTESIDSSETNQESIEKSVEIIEGEEQIIFSRLMETVEKPVEKKENVALVEAEPEVLYSAPLVGFGTVQAARVFVDRMKKADIHVMIKERFSKTRGGKKIVWYQVVTQDYGNKEDLEDVIAQVQEKEKLKSVKIVEKRKVTVS